LRGNDATRGWRATDRDCSQLQRQPQYDQPVSLALSGGHIALQLGKRAFPHHFNAIAAKLYLPRPRSIRIGAKAMADIFISYTAADRDWAFWIAKEREALDHVPHVHEWEIERGGDIYAWMEQRHDTADHVLCVVSDDYLKAPCHTLDAH